MEIKEMYSVLSWRDKKWTLWGSIACGLIYKESIEEVKNNPNLSAYAVSDERGIWVDGQKIGSLLERRVWVPRQPKDKKPKNYADYLREYKERNGK